jgi:hypothetical protein
MNRPSISSDALATLRPARLDFAQRQLHGAGGQVHLLAAVDRAQALGLKVAGLAGGTLDGGVGDLLAAWSTRFCPFWMRSGPRKRRSYR